SEVAARRTLAALDQILTDGPTGFRRCCPTEVDLRAAYRTRGEVCWRGEGRRRRSCRRCIGIATEIIRRIRRPNTIAVGIRTKQTSSVTVSGCYRGTHL